MTRAEEASIAYQLVAHGPRVMGGDAVLSDDDFKFWNINYDFAAGYKQAEKDLGWISVKDRLPEEGHFVLTCVSDNGTPQCVGMALLLKDGTWWDGDMKVNVDYWMEVPKLPKEEENETK